MFERMVETAPDALTWHDSDGTIRFASAAFGELFGHDPEAVRGRRLSEFVYPTDVDAIHEAHDELVGTGRRFCVSYRLRDDDGWYVWVESRGGTPADDDGPWYVVVTRDISARRSLLAALTVAPEILARHQDEMDREISFFTTVAHATRRPVTSILGFASLLRDQRHQMSEGRVAQLLERLAAAADDLAAIIDRGTTLGELSPPRRRTGDFGCRLKDAVSKVLEEIAAPDSPVEVDVDEHLAVAASREDVERLVDLLVTNAVMHTPVGTRVWISGQPGDSDVTITVEDDGPGVPDDDKELIFRPFRSAGSRADYNPGIGLGLAIVARTAAAYGGDAWVTDRAQGGAAFHVRLPLAPVAPEDLAD